VGWKQCLGMSEKTVDSEAEKTKGAGMRMVQSSSLRLHRLEIFVITGVEDEYDDGKFECEVGSGGALNLTAAALLF